MVHTRVRGVVCWTYLLPNLLIHPPAPHQARQFVRIWVVPWTCWWTLTLAGGGNGAGREMFPVPAVVTCIPLSRCHLPLAWEHKRRLNLSALRECNFSCWFFSNSWNGFQKNPGSASFLLYIILKEKVSSRNTWRVGKYVSVCPNTFYVSYLLELGLFHLSP